MAEIWAADIGKPQREVELPDKDPVPVPEPIEVPEPIPVPA